VRGWYPGRPTDGESVGVGWCGYSVAKERGAAGHVDKLKLELRTKKTILCAGYGTLTLVLSQGDRSEEKNMSLYYKG